MLTSFRCYIQFLLNWLSILALWQAKPLIQVTLHFTWKLSVPECGHVYSREISIENLRGKLRKRSRLWWQTEIARKLKKSRVLQPIWVHRRLHLDGVLMKISFILHDINVVFPISPFFVHWKVTKHFISQHLSQWLERIYCCNLLNLFSSFNILSTLSNAKNLIWPCHFNAVWTMSKQISDDGWGR